MSNFFLPHIRDLKPYSSARDEFSVEKESSDSPVFLDANENCLGAGSKLDSSLNRYPDPLQKKLKQAVAHFYSLSQEQLFLGNGSDEAIDLLIRATCEPQVDRVLISSPTYGVYQVLADLNRVEVVDVPLKEGFRLDVESILATEAKLIFICSPNNPSGNKFDKSEVESIVSKTKALVVLDEAYADFADSRDGFELLETYSNLVVLRTFSKSWGLAGARLGVCVASPSIIEVLNKIKLPYNISGPSQRIVLEAIENNQDFNKKSLEFIKDEREKLASALEELGKVKRVFASVSNFLLVQFEDSVEASELYAELVSEGYIVRDRSKLPLCKNCLRITVGSKEENAGLISKMKSIFYV